MKNVDLKNETPVIGNVLLADSSLSFFLDYEIRSSWWASWIGWNCVENNMLSHHGDELAEQLIKEATEI